MGGCEGQQSNPENGSMKRVFGWRGGEGGGEWEASVEEELLVFLEDEQRNNVDEEESE